MGGVGLTPKITDTFIRQQEKKYIKLFGYFLDIKALVSGKMQLNSEKTRCWLLAINSQKYLKNSTVVPGNRKFFSDAALFRNLLVVTSSQFLNQKLAKTNEGLQTFA